jgi:hypothetical protein
LYTACARLIEVPASNKAITTKTLSSSFFIAG